MPHQFKFVLVMALLTAYDSAPGWSAGPNTQTGQATAVDATTVRGKVMCGYQGWFRCPGDAAGHGLDSLEPRCAADRAGSAHVRDVAGPERLFPAGAVSGAGLHLPGRPPGRAVQLR